MLIGHAVGWLRETSPIAAPLWVGGVIVGGVAALVAYVLTYRGVLKFRRRRASAGPPDGPRQPA